MEHAVQAKFYENAMEKAYHAALADLFKKTDTIYHLYDENEGNLPAPQQCSRSMRPGGKHHLQHRDENNLIVHESRK